VNYTWNFGIIFKYWQGFVNGLIVTYELTLWSLLFSTIIALMISLMAVSSRIAFRICATAYVEVFRTIPSLVTLVWIYYVLPIVTGISFEAKVSVIIGLSICQSAHTAEVFRAGIESIEKGQMESARSLGMSHSLSMRRIILPQAFRILIPAFMNEFNGLLKWTSLASILGVAEVMQRSNSMITQSFQPLEVYTITALSYVVVVLPITQLARLLERKRSF